MVTGLHWDEPARDGSQSLSRTWQCTQGKILAQYFKLYWKIVSFKWCCNLSSSSGFNRRWTDQERPLFTIRGLQNYKHKRQLKHCCQWVNWPHVKSLHVSLCIYIWHVHDVSYVSIWFDLVIAVWLFSYLVVYVSLISLQGIMMALCQYLQRCS